MSEAHNFKMECECGNQIFINIKEPEDWIEVVDEIGENPILIHPVKDEKCHVSELWSNGAEILGIDNVQLTVVSKTLERYKNVDVSKRIVAEQGLITPCFIENFRFAVKQIN
ncbi:hypothetical protein NUSPORA_00402 [Nucleospora cyclopteri]